MLEAIFRFERTIDSNELPAILDGSVSVTLVDTGLKADLGKIEAVIDRLIASKKTKLSDYDIHVSEALHSNLKHLPPSLTRDMRFWEWLTILRFPKFVWARWFDGVPNDLAAALAKDASRQRFLGSRSLRGRNRNALSRLYFTAEILHDTTDGYKLAATAFANQDRHTSIFERELGLVPDAAKALIRLTSGMDSKKIQKTVKRLNHIASSLVLEVVSEQEIIRLLK